MTVDDVMAVFEELDGASDRAAAIVGATFIEDELRRLLERHLKLALDEKGIEKHVFGVGAVLGEAGRRVSFAYALGLISKDEFAAIRTLLEVRNKFAHTLKLAFDDPPVTASVGMLGVAGEGTARARWMNACIHYWGQLIARGH